MVVKAGKIKSGSSATAVVSIPSLLLLIPFFRELRANPVFSSSMRKSRTRPVTEVRPYFKLGMIISAIISLGLLQTWGYENSPMILILLMGWVFPIAGMVAVTHIYMFVLSLTMGPVMRTSGAKPGEIDPVNSTILTDREIYLGQALPCFVYGISVLRIMLALFYGLAIPVLEILGLYGVFGIFPWLGIIGQTIPLLTLIMILFIGLGLMMLLVSLASVAYSTLYKPVQATAFTILHYAAVRALVEWIGHDFGVWLTNPVYWLDHIDMIMTMRGMHLLVMGYTLKVGLVLLACAFTARVGIWMQGRVRRRR